MDDIPTIVCHSSRIQTTIDKEWLKTIYAEAWRQYTHEDILSQQRNIFFWGFRLL
jgi:hypothetical protein